MSESFNKGWKFCLGDGDYAAPACDDSAWKSLSLPHDWSVDYPVDEKAPAGGGGGYAVTGTGWYRKRFQLPPGSAGKRVHIRFDGVYQDSTVYINGKLAGGRHYGYSSFTIDATDFVVNGENVAAVRVDNSLQPNSRWYSGSGIYRNVWLSLLDPVHIAEDGVFAAINGLYLDNTKARLQIETRVQNDSAAAATVWVQHKLFDAAGKEVLVDAVSLRVDAGQEASCRVAPTVEQPHLWTDRDPYLYTLETSVYNGEKLVDSVKTRTGIRTAAFDCDRGFLLNGERVKIKGMCVHHDGGLTGAAFYRDTWKRRLKTLKEMGCNGIRSAHNPPAPELLDLCDEMGFLVMDEAFDEWYLCKGKGRDQRPGMHNFGGSLFFSEDGDMDLLSMLRRDRNHPSVIIWSIGNEIPDQSAIGGVETLLHLQDICHREDPTRMVTTAMDNLAQPDQGRTREAFECAIDVAGYNYVARWGMRAETLYDEDRRKFPNRRFLGSENGSAGGIRGNYERDTTGIWRRNYDTTTLNHEFNWRFTASRDFVAGDYLWTGIDYLGETMWPSRGAMGAPIDAAGFVKDAFYYFRSIWNPDALTLHICPHWNWKGKEGEYITVIGYTNCDEVKLYVNGRLVATRGYDFPNVGAMGAWNKRARDTHPTTHDLHLTWDVVYEPGELKAVGYRNGKAVAEQVIQTTGKPEKLAASPDVSTLPVDGLAHIEIETTDAEGRHVPTADTMVTVKVEGAAELLGMDSGNMRDQTLAGEPSRALFAGKLLCVVKGTKPGAAKVTLSAPGMADLTLNFTVS